MEIFLKFSSITSDRKNLSKIQKTYSNKQGFASHDQMTFSLSKFGLIGPVFLKT